MQYIIDARRCENEETNFLTLGLWGKTCSEYVVDALSQIVDLDRIVYITNDSLLAHIIRRAYPTIHIKNDVDAELLDEICLLNGRCPLLRSETIKTVVDCFKQGGVDCVSSGKVTSTEHWNSLIEKPLPVVFVGNKKNLFNDSRCVLIAEDEQVVINTKNSFEVALVLLNKRAKGIWLIEQIKKRIDEKRYVLKSNVENSICLVGHSQFDQWDIDMIGDMPVQNCGISGINSFEYLQLILKQNLFSTSAENIVILHGTNDIVCDKDICEIVDSIQANIDYIKESNPNSRLFLLKCIHVNGRLDRSNAKIDKLNEALLREVRDASLVDVSVFDDEFGNLRAEYTKDGLHLSQAGYTVMNELISGVVKNE